MKIFIGNCWSTLDGYTPELEEAMAVAHESYWFSAKYKSGLWDGKTHFLKIPSLRFPTGLLYVVTDFLDACGTEYEITDTRVRPVVREDRWPAEIDGMLGGITLRPYQDEAVTIAIGSERGCLEMATGSGKTEVAAAIIKLLGLKTLFLVHTKDLLRQTKKRFETRLHEDIGMLGDSICDIDHDIVVATVQSVSANLSVSQKATENWLNAFQVMFLDECHHTSAATWYKIGLLMKNAYFRFGLSGTVLRRDNLSNMKMLAVFGKPIYQLPASTLIEQGHLSGIRIHMVPNAEVVKGATWQQVYDAGVVHSAHRNKMIADIAEAAHNTGRRVMILVRMIEHGKILKHMLQEERNVSVKFLWGGSKSSERGDTIASFDGGDHFIIIASTIFDEGVDIPSINVLIVAAGGKSEVRAIQRTGRGLRKKEDMTDLVVYDFIDDSKFLRKHSARRLSVYKKEKFI